MVEFCNNSDRRSCISFNRAWEINNIEVILLSLNTIFLEDSCRAYSQHIKNMSSIPQGMFAAKKLKEKHDLPMAVARISIGDGSTNSKKYFNTRLMELTPLKYNSKLMNSIWGLYNRYSPHNIKSTIDETNRSGDLQQFVANLSKSAVKDGVDGGIKLSGKVQNSSGVPNFENLWNNLPISQSH